MVSVQCLEIMGCPADCIWTSENSGISAGNLELLGRDNWIQVNQVLFLLIHQSMSMAEKEQE